MVVFINKLLVTGILEPSAFCGYETHFKSSGLGFTKTRALSTGIAVWLVASRAQEQLALARLKGGQKYTDIMLFLLLELTCSQLLLGVGLYLYLYKELRQKAVDTVHPIPSVGNR